jgi:hypothetical protein
MNIRNRTDNKSTLSIGTESQYSETSADTQTGGGFLSFLFGPDKGMHATELSLDAFGDKLPQIACYTIKNAINKGYDLDLSKGDKTGKTILHFLVIFSAFYIEAKEVLLEIMSLSEAKQAKNINAQDDKGNTPTHYAVYLEQDDVVNLLANSGANLKIKNKEGLSISLSDTSSQKPNPVINTPEIFVKHIKKYNNTRPANVDEQVTDLVKMFRHSDSADTIGFRRSESECSGNSRPEYTDDQQSANPDSVDILNMILNEFKEGRANLEVNRRREIMTGGSKKINTSNTITGRRKLATYSELSMTNSANETSISDSSYSSLNDSDLKDLSEMAHALANKDNLSRGSNEATEAHNNAVEKIKALKKVDDAEARAYKALLWDAIKQEHPEMENYDKSMELLKRASDPDYLGKIKKSEVTKMIKIIEDRKKERESSSSEEKPKKKRESKRLKSESSATSSVTYSDSESDLETLSSIVTEIF